MRAALVTIMLLACAPRRATAPPTTQLVPAPARIEAVPERATTTNVAAEENVRPCAGERIRVSLRDLENDDWACACHETERRGTAIRVGSWCGPPRPDESSNLQISVTTPQPLLASGEDLAVTVHLGNPSDRTVSYRLQTRHLFARLASPVGGPLPNEVLSSAASRDEALVQIAPHGVLEITLPVSGRYARDTGAGATVSSPLAPGAYTVRVLGLDAPPPPLVPVFVR